MENIKSLRHIVKIIENNDLADRSHIINLIAMINESIITLSYYDDNTHTINALSQINKILIDLLEV